MLALLSLVALAPQDVHCTETVLQAPAGKVFSTSHDANVQAILDGSIAILPGGGVFEFDLFTYERDAVTGAWSLRSTLSSPDGGTWFAHDYDLEREADGTLTLLVGEPKWKNAGGVERGSVRVYEWEPTSGVWNQVQQILPPISGTARFGLSVSRDGEWAAVGSDGQGRDVYMYRRAANGHWSYHATIDAPVGGFGADSDLSGDVYLVEALVHSEGKVYRRSATDEWQLEATLPGPMFHPQVLDDEIVNRVLVSVGAYSTGRLQIFRRDAGSGTWSIAQELDETWFPPYTLENVGIFQRFSAGEDMLLAAGALAEGAGGETYAGAAYAFRRDAQTGAWVADQVLRRDPPLQYQELGKSVAVDGTRGLLLSNMSEQALWVDLDPTDCDGNGAPDLCELQDPLRDRNADGVLDACQTVGTVYCTPNANSTGHPGRIGAVGSAVLSDAHLDVCADRLPQNEFGYLISSSAPGFLPNVGGSSGNLCVAGGSDFGRFTDQIRFTGPLGVTCTTVPLPYVPTAHGPHALQPGETWYFQFWYRDGSTSNHTDGVEVLFE